MTFQPILLYFISKRPNPKKIRSNPDAPQNRAPRKPPTPTPRLTQVHYTSSTSNNFFDIPRLFSSQRSVFTCNVKNQLERYRPADDGDPGSGHRRGKWENAVRPRPEDGHIRRKGKPDTHREARLFIPGDT